jgi:hypothetical protein
LDLLEDNIEIAILRAEVITPDLNPKHEIILRRCIKCAELGVGLAIGGGSVVDGGSIDGIEDHAGKGDHNCDDYTHRNETTRECSVLCLLLIPKHLKRIKKISHFYSLFHVLEEFHGLLLLVSNNVYNYIEIFKITDEIYHIGQKSLKIAIIDPPFSMPSLIEFYFIPIICSYVSKMQDYYLYSQIFFFFLFLEFSIIPSFREDASSK